MIPITGLCNTLINMMLGIPNYQEATCVSKPIKFDAVSEILLLVA